MTKSVGVQINVRNGSTKGSHFDLLRIPSQVEGPFDFLKALSHIEGLKVSDR